MKNVNYYLAAIASFVIWGFISFSLKPLHIYASLDLLFFRIFFAAGIISLFTFFLRPKNFLAQRTIFKKLTVKHRKQTVLLTIVGGLLLTANWFFYIFVMNTISIKTAAFAYLVCPILTTVLAGIIIKEKLSKIQWTAVAISAVSCTILGMHSAVDLAYSMIVAVSYALYLISQRKNVYLDKMVILTFQMLSSALLLAPFFPFFSSHVSYDASFYFQISILAVVFTILPLFLNLFALKEVNSSTMGILLYINPLLSFVIAFLYFDEQISAAQLIAYTCILISILVFNWKVIFSFIRK
ncbi:MAG: EamA family transporter [Bacteroidetes bacterium]|nr:EamA family transporter [Bacteroidota bacterium]